jgi:hypothetical protein
MSKKRINPLTIHKVRRAVFCPPYFESMTLPPGVGGRGTVSTISRWIYENMSGRYYIGPEVELAELNDSSCIVIVQRVAFENPSELSIFMLSCPYLK